MPPETGRAASAGTGRDTPEVEALITDRYLESLLAAHATGADLAPAPTELDPRVRLVAERLSRALPRVHPSFRFEEALSARLTAAALARRAPQAAGAEGVVVTLPGRGAQGSLDDPDLAAYLEGAGLDDEPDLVRPLLIGGALTSAAISLAGAAIVAWRWRRDAAAPMARAVRAVARTRLS